MSNPTVILNGDQVYCDELIRENARLTIQHEAERLTLEQMREQCVSSEECTAVAALRFVMAGGDPCRVCAVKCTFGEGNCKPVWRGEAGADL